MFTAIFAALTIILVLLVYLAWKTVRDAPDRAELASLKMRDKDYQDAARQLSERSALTEALRADNAKLAADLDNEKRAAAEKLNLLQDAENRLKKEFENLANRIFEDKGRTFSEQNRDRMGALLQPFKEQLDSFRRRVDEVHRDDTERSARLLEQVRQLQDLSNRVSDDANNLAKAIKGDSKQQGNWGEFIIERIFQASGLEDGREYMKQKELKTDDGERQRPDFIVLLPGDKSVIVDSKVSLTAYERFSSAEDEPGRESAMAEHIQSVRRHINDLRQKDYSNLLGNKTLDFVLMCIPLEPAYQAVLQADPDIIYDTGRHNVVITGPTTLMITLKLIAQIWRRERENRNAEIIADRAGRLYDQVSLIIDAMDIAQKRLSDVSEAFDSVMKRLKDGKGNLVRRVEELRRLGAKVNKNISPDVLNQATADEDEGEIQEEL